ncbi:hypothetical protein RhiirA4_532027 [Rhizophagus irregularis]|uniref:Uncharacterized protein n=1 Tax=Rhizophagus irregularis TaxID=588596 RepID=A0A2I1GWT4_9GLOM|nr:hypothetical protein RhiirA4_532027 [Rhizophagus irregularis]
MDNNHYFNPDNGFNQLPNQDQTENSYNNGSNMVNDSANTARNTNSPNLPQYAPQNNAQLNYSQTNHSGIFTFSIPGLKIIIIPTLSPNNSEIFTLDIPDFKVIMIILSLS